MIELLMALFLLILLVGFTGIGLSGVLELQDDSIQLEKATEIASFIRDEHAAGAEAEELLEIVKKDWPASVVRLEEFKDDEKRTWDVWSIQSRKDAPGLELEFVHPIHKSTR